MFSAVVSAQEEAVSLSTEQEGKYLLFKASNSSIHPQEVTVRITEAKGLQDNKRPTTKVVQPNEEIVIKQILISGGTYSYNYEHNFSIPKDYKESKMVELTDVSAINEGIVVFNRDSCGRCHLTTNYLIEKGIDFRIINIQDNEDNRKLMGKVLAENGMSGKVLTPVIVVNGDVSHSHEDLKKFLKTLE